MQQTHQRVSNKQQVLDKKEKKKRGGRQLQCRFSLGGLSQLLFAEGMSKCHRNKLELKNKGQTNFFLEIAHPKKLGEHHDC